MNIHIFAGYVDACFFGISCLWTKLHKKVDANMTHSTKHGKRAAYLLIDHVIPKRRESASHPLLTSGEVLQVFSTSKTNIELKFGAKHSLRDKFSKFWGGKKMTFPKSFYNFWRNNSIVNQILFRQINVECNNASKLESFIKNHLSKHSVHLIRTLYFEDLYDFSNFKFEFKYDWIIDLEIFLI